MILGSPRFAGSFLDMFRSEKCVIMGIKDIESRRTYGRMEDDKDENNSISRKQHQLPALWRTRPVSVYRICWIEVSSGYRSQYVICEECKRTGD